MLLHLQHAVAQAEVVAQLVGDHRDRLLAAADQQHALALQVAVQRQRREGVALAGAGRPGDEAQGVAGGVGQGLALGQAEGGRQRFRAAGGTEDHALLADRILAQQLPQCRRMALRALQQLQFMNNAAAAGTALGQGHQRCGAQRQALRSHGLLQRRGALQHREGAGRQHLADHGEALQPGHQVGQVVIVQRTAGQRQAFQPRLGIGLEQLAQQAAVELGLGEVDGQAGWRALAEAFQARLEVHQRRAVAHRPAFRIATPAAHRQHAVDQLQLALVEVLLLQQVLAQLGRQRGEGHGAAGQLLAPVQPAPALGLEGADIVQLQFAAIGLVAGAVEGQAFRDRRHGASRAVSSGALCRNQGDGLNRRMRILGDGFTVGALPGRRYAPLGD